MYGLLLSQIKVLEDWACPSHGGRIRCEHKCFNRRRVQMATEPCAFGYVIKTWVLCSTLM